MRWLRKLLDGVRVNDGVRVQPWIHSKDRRAPAQLKSYSAVLEQRRELAQRQADALWHGVFGPPDLHAAHVTEYELHRSRTYIDSNVLQFKRRA